MATNSLFDTDWIMEEQKMTNALHNCSPEPLETISVEVLYIDMNKKVNTVDTFNIKLEPDKQLITKEQLLSLSQRYKKDNKNTQYILKDILLYHISILPSRMNDFVNNELDNGSFFRSYYPLRHDIHIHPSIFIFHPSSTLFFIYHEEEKNPIKQLKSALKDSNSTTSKRRITKRVRIKAPRHTRRTES